MLASIILWFKEDVLVFKIMGLITLSLTLIAGPKEPFKAKLINGLNLIVLENHSVPQAWVQVWYNVGSKDEVDGHTGLAHILEHTMFHGTKLQPNFNAVISECGGYANASTYYDFTNYYENIDIACLPKMLMLEADRMKNLLLDPKTVALELKAVREERLGQEQSPEFLLYEQAMAALYIRGPYHHLPIGWMADIENTQLADIKAWYQNWYVPNNATLIVAGDVVPQQVLALANKYFSKIPARVLPVRTLRPNVPLRATSKLAMNSQLLAENSVSISYLVPSIVSAKDPKEVYALEVLAALLSYGDNSLMNRKLVQTGKALSAVAYYSPMRRFQTNFVLGMSASKKKPAEDDLLQLLKSLHESGILNRDLKRAQALLIANDTFSKDNYGELVTRYGYNAVLGREVSELSSYKDNIKLVKAQDVLRVLDKYILSAKYVQQSLNKG